MIELMLGTYGVFCWLLFKKFKLIPVNTYTVCTAILGGIVMLSGLLILLIRYHPVTKDARLYVYTTPIVPQVRGQVIEVIPEGRQVKQGDVLFKIDPSLYKFEVERLEAQLAGANTDLAKLEQKVQGAEAATKQAKANLAASESDYDKQAREDLERAKQEVTQTKTQAEFASVQEGRYKELLAAQAASQLEYDKVKRQAESTAALLKQAQAAERQAEEKIKSGGDRMRSSREAVSQAEAQERAARLELESQSGGVNPQVREIMASLDAARWNLEQTVVQAPADGYTTQVKLRRGQIVVPFPLAPVMVFVHAEAPVLLASYPQNVIANFKPGLEAELTFKAYPGRIFKAKVSKILPTTAEGQLLASGQVQSLVSGSASGRIPVAFEYDEKVSELNLPGGSLAYAAVYTEHVHVLSIIRKILLRIKAWENYIFLP